MWWITFLWVLCGIFSIGSLIKEELKLRKKCTIDIEALGMFLIFFMFGPLTTLVIIFNTITGYVGQHKKKILFEFGPDVNKSEEEN